MTARTLRFEAPETVSVREHEVPAPDDGEVQVAAECSAVSPGTELLVYQGDAPTDLAADPELPALAGDFEFPLEYGYAVVGRVTAVGEGIDPAWHDRRVFAFHPHASHFCASPADLHVVPDDCGAESAAFLPNVETAVNLLQDGAPLVGEHVAVFGQGVVGLLTTALLGEYPLDRLVTVDCYADRRDWSRDLGADVSLAPDGSGGSDAGPDVTAPTARANGGVERGASDASERVRTALADDAADESVRADLTYELSGSPDALDSAVAATGYDGRVLVGSWYGTKPTELHLGGRFHRSRISVESSQVSTIDPPLRGRWSKDRRLDVAWDRLSEIDPGRLVTHRFDVGNADEAYRLLDERPEDALGVIFEY